MRVCLRYRRKWTSVLLNEYTALSTGSGYNGKTITIRSGNPSTFRSGARSQVNSLAYMPAFTSPSTLQGHSLAVDCLPAGSQRASLPLAFPQVVALACLPGAVVEAHAPSSHAREPLQLPSAWRSDWSRSGDWSLCPSQGRQSWSRGSSCPDRKVSISPHVCA